MMDKVRIHICNIRLRLAIVAIVVIMSAVLAAVLAGCGSAAGGSQSADRLVEEGDHIAMQAAEGTSAEVLESDARILEGRLLSFAGEGNYRIDVTPPQENEESGAGQIDIYMDSKIKGDERLRYLSRAYLSGKLRYSLYSLDVGYLNASGNEAYNVPLGPSDIAQAEVTEDYPKELSDTSWGKIPAIKVCLTEDFMNKYGQIIAGWTKGIGIIADIEDRTWKEYEENFVIDSMKLIPSGESGVYYIIESEFTDNEREHVAGNLKKEPLCGDYEVTVSAAIDWNGKGLDPAEFEHLCTQAGFEEACKDKGSGEDTRNATFTLYLNDKDMETEERTKILNSLCRRMDAMGMPYCIGEVEGQEETVAVKTLPDHINEDVIRILQSESPFNLAAGERKIALESELYEAKVVTLGDGDLALDIYMKAGRKDTVYEMTREMELLGGGDTIVYLMRSKPVCGCFTTSAVKDGHLVLDRNYTGIGGSTWNAGNRWILDLMCSVINDSGYPVQKIKTSMITHISYSAFNVGEYFETDSSGRLYSTVQPGFTDEVTVSETTEQLAKIAPSAVLGDKSVFDEHYGVYNIYLNLSQEEYSEKASDLLGMVYKMVQTGPILNANVFLTQDARESISIYTFWEDSEIIMEENSYVTEEYFAMEMSKVFRENPGIMFSFINIENLMNEAESIIDK